ETTSRYADQLNQLLATSKPTTAIDLSALQSAIARLQQQASNYDLALRSLITSGKTISELKAINQMLLQAERKLLSEAGLPRRPWFKHQVYAPGFYTGYGVKTMPGVREAIEEKKWAEVSEQVQVLSKTLNAFADHLEAITRKLQSH
ncbi:MAG TPA: transferrin receptor-like dimerization domain-containing protein, partial [Blastocatellia bacterium]|nr:transferrin receptor-like dimerization domain-containing protein [Blastocatellia bacterium]